MKQYANYHKHDHVSNIFVPDTHIKCEDYLKRIKELEYNCYWTTNHGSGGDIFEARDLCDKYGIKCFFGVEGYIVPNPLEKDNRNYHIIIIPRTNEARKDLNLVTSRASSEGYYYKPRIFMEDLLKLNPNDYYFTTACVAGIIRDDDSTEKIFKPLVTHFGQNVFLEVQNHLELHQIEINKKALELSTKYNLKLIAANDSHYIYPDQGKDRLEFLKGKGINYGDEDGYILDYPDYDVFAKRFKEQGVLSDDQITQAINNTLLFEECEEIYIDHSMKMPSAYPTLSPDEKIAELKEHINKRFAKIIEQDHISTDQFKTYRDGIRYEMKTIEDTKILNTADYFLLNEKIVDLAVHKYGGVLTRSGRGSCGAFYINRILGMTQIDRFRCPITLYPDRFISTARLLENNSTGDIDYNVADQKPFIQATQEVLGEHGVYPMIAYGTMQIGEAFRNVCRSHGLTFNDFNEVAKDIESYKDDEKWKPLYDEAQKYVDTIVSASVHPCFTAGSMVATENGYIPIEEIQKGDMVFSSDGHLHRVANTMITKNQNVVMLKIRGQTPVFVTPNHPYLVLHKKKKQPHKGLYYVEYSQPQWKSVSELQSDDMVCVPVDQEEVCPEIEGVEFSESLMWLIGRYLGDGWLRNQSKYNHGYEIIICCRAEEKDVIIKHLNNIHHNFWITQERTVNRIHFNNKALYIFLKGFGKGAHNKFIPEEVLRMPIPLLKPLIEGYLSADGYCMRNGVYSFTTVSQKLALTMQRCVHKVYHTYCCLVRMKRKDNILEGRLLKGNIQYIGRINFEFPKNPLYAYDQQNKCFWVRFAKTEIVDGSFDVYNIEVEDTHTYTVNNTVVHNCAHLLDHHDIRREYGVVKIGEFLCCMITSGEADAWHCLKNDYLIVSVWGIISDVFKKIGKPILTLNELMNDLDDRIWKLYENGITCTLNQLDSDYATGLAKIYKPHTVAELAHFTGAIRPSFDAWRDDFLHRRPYTTGSKQLDEVLHETGGMILYQESLMAYFDWLGITPAESIGLIKKISKKKIHPEDFQKLEERLLDKWVENTGSEEGFKKTWEMIQGCMSYGYAAPHAYAVTCDNLYCAWLKIHYPLEYYSVVFGYYEGDMERTNKLVRELDYFGIKLKSVEFGKASGSYQMDKENNTIYKSIASIKYCNTEIGDELYSIGQNKPKTFLDFLAVNPCNSRQTEILITLGFFKCYGPAKTLLKTVEYYNKYQCTGATKQFKKDNIPLEAIPYIEKYANQETEKMYKLDKANVEALLKEIVSTIPQEELPLKEVLNAESEYLGYIATTIPNADGNAFITELETRGTNFRITLYDLTTGESHSVKLKKKSYQVTPVQPGDIITYRLGTEQPWYKDEDGKWKQDPNKEPQEILEWYGLNHKWD